VARRPTSELVVHAGTLGLRDDELVAGRVLALEVPFAESVRLAPGVALDDYVPEGSRAAVDADAQARLRAWRELRAGDLTIDGVDLTHVWEVELLAECFIPLARLRAALPEVVARHAPRRLVGAGVAPGLLALVAAVAREHGLDTVASGAAGGATIVAPRVAGSPVARLLAATGVPSRARGSVLCLPYWHLQPVLDRLAAPGSGVRPVAGGVVLPVSRTADRARTAWRGGWLGHPSRRARERARRQVGGRLDALAGRSDGSIDAAIDELASSMLRERAPDSLARARQARRALARGRVRLALLPFDSPESARIVLAAAHDAGATSLVVQHGFDAGLNDPDKTLAAHVAVWSERDRAHLAAVTASPLTVTGNPGVEHLAAGVARTPRGRGRGRSLVLVEYPSRLSARVRARIGGEHTEAALAGLAMARPGTTAVIRPHPSDPGPESYARLGAAHPGLTVRVDASTPIEALLATVDLCVGAISTATLQAAALGVPVVYLDATTVQRPWPFGGSDGLPRATGPDDLAEQVGVVLAAGEVLGRDAALDALGVRPDAVDRVCGLVDELLRR
jgi:hypothetical protein